MVEFSIEQKRTIDAYRNANKLGFAIPDSVIAEMILKEMQSTGKVYEGFESLANSVAQKRTTKEPTNQATNMSSNASIWGTTAIEEEFMPSFSLGIVAQRERKEAQAQPIALDFLARIVNEGQEIFDARELENGAMSEIVNAWKEIGNIFVNVEAARSNVRAELDAASKDLAKLQQAANGELTYFDLLTLSTKTKDFAQAFREQRGVEFNPDAINECIEKSEEFARIKSTVDMINHIQSTLGCSTTGEINDQMSPEVASNGILQAFKLCGITKLEDANKTLADIEDMLKDHPDIKKYGGNFKIFKDNGKYVITRISKAGSREPATNEQLRLIAQEMSLRLDKTLADALGIEYSPNVTAKEMSNTIQGVYDKYQHEYEESFAKAFGKKDVKALADMYVLKQQQGVANWEIGLNILSMALMVVPGGTAAATGLLSKVAAGTNYASKVQKVASAAIKVQSSTQKIAPLLMTAMTVRPIELVEQLTSENGMSAEEWKTWGQGVLQNTVYMTVGMGVSKVAEFGAAMYKTKALVETLKTAGKSFDEIQTMIKANPIKFPNEIVKSMTRTDALAKGLQISSEAALDIGSTIMLNKAMGNETLPQDVIYSIVFALNGGLLQKQFMPLSEPQKIEFLMKELGDYGITERDAFRILEKMDEISKGEVKLEEAVAKKEHSEEIKTNIEEVVPQNLKVFKDIEEIRQELVNCKSLEELRTHYENLVANGFAYPATKNIYHIRVKTLIRIEIAKAKSIEDIIASWEKNDKLGHIVESDLYTQFINQIAEKEYNQCNTIEEVRFLKESYIEKGYSFIEDFYFTDRINKLVNDNFSQCKSLDELIKANSVFQTKNVDTEGFFNSSVKPFIMPEIITCKTIDDFIIIKEKYNKKGISIEEIFESQKNEILDSEIKRIKTYSEFSTFIDKCLRKGLYVSQELYKSTLYGFLLTDIKQCKTTNEIDIIINKYKQENLNISENVINYYKQKLINPDLSPIEIRIKESNNFLFDISEKENFDPTNPKYVTDPTRVCKELESRFQKEMNVLDEQQISQIVHNISSKMNVSEKEVLEVLSKLTQYGSIKTLKEFGNKLKKLNISKFYNKSGVSTNTSLQYLHQRGQINLKTEIENGKQAFILDDASIKYLEKLNESELQDFYQKVSDGDIVLIEMEGTGLKIEDNYYSYTMLDGGQNLSAMTEAVIMQIQTGKSLEETLQGDFRTRLSAVFKNFDTNFVESHLKTISIEKTPSIKNITSQLKPNMPDAEFIEKIIDLVIKENKKGLTPEEQITARGVILKYYDYMAKIYSSDSLAELLKIKYEKIEQYAIEQGKTMDDVIYICPDLQKSFSLVCLQYAKTNGIDPSKIFLNERSNNLPEFEGKIVVILDDIVGSGASMNSAINYSAIRKENNFNVLFCPIMCAKEGQNKLNKDISISHRKDKDLLLYDSEQGVGFKDFKNIITPEENRILMKIIGDLGFNDNALVTGFQHMTPDNNSTLSGYLNLANLNDPTGSANKAPSHGDKIETTLYKYLIQQNLINRLKSFIIE